MTARLVAFCAVFVLAGCSPPSDATALLPAQPEQTWTVRDTAFIIGVQDGPSTHTLFLPRYPLLTETGQVLVVHAQTEFRVFHRDGSFVRSFGGKGGGPGEYTTITGFRRVEDNRYMVIDQQRVVTVIDSLGVEYERFRLEPRPEINARVAILGDGRVSALLPSRRLDQLPPQPKVLRDTVPLVLYGRDGKQERTLAQVRGLPWLVESGTAWGVPFGPRPSIAAIDDVLAVSEGVQKVVRFLSMDGREAEVGLNVRPRTRTDAHLDAWVRERREVWDQRGAPASAPVLQPGHEDVVPKTLPAYLTLRFDDRGCLWAQEQRVPGDEHLTWDILDPAGRFVAQIQVPGSFALSQITGDEMIGISTDQLGIQRILTLRIEGRTPEGRCGSPFS